MKIVKNSNRPYNFAARKLVDLVRRSCYAGFQRAVTKCIGTAARRTASVTSRRSWQAGLQLEVAIRRNVTAARKVALDHSATFMLCGIAAGACESHCNGCTKRRIGLQKLQELAGRQLMRAQVAQISDCSEEK